MTHTAEEFVRRELRSILRGDTYRNRFVCLPCLMSQYGPDGDVRWKALQCAGVGHSLGTNSAGPTRSSDPHPLYADSAADRWRLVIL